MLGGTDPPRIGGPLINKLGEHRKYEREMKSTINKTTIRQHGSKSRAIPFCLHCFQSHCTHPQRYDQVSHRDNIMLNQCLGVLSLFLSCATKIAALPLVGLALMTSPELERDSGIWSPRRQKSRSPWNGTPAELIIQKSPSACFQTIHPRLTLRHGC